MQDLVELQQRSVGQVLRDAAERQAAVVQVSQQEGRQVGGEPPEPGREQRVRGRRREESRRYQEEQHVPED